MQENTLSIYATESLLKAVALFVLLGFFLHEYGILCSL